MIADVSLIVGLYCFTRLLLLARPQRDRLTLVLLVVALVVVGFLTLDILMLGAGWPANEAGAR